MSRIAAIVFSFSLAAAASDDGQPPPAAAAPPLPAESAATPPQPAAPVEAIPKAFPAERYQASWQKNPFLLKTAPVVQQKESWAADWALASIAQIGGKYRVSIKNKKTGEYERITSGGDSKNGFGIVSVNLKPSRKASSVELTKAGETAVVTYDESVNAPAARPGMAPGQSTMGRAIMPGQPAAIPGATTAPPGVPGSRTARTVSTTGGAFSSPNQAMAMNQPPGANYSGYQRPPMVSGGGGFVGNPNLPAGSAANPISRTTPAGTTTGTSTVPQTSTATGSSAVSAGTVNVAVPSVNTATTTTASGTTTTATTTPATTTTGPRRRQLIPAPTVNSNP